MSDITVVILTYNEEIHIERCIQSVLPIAQEIYLIDSYSTDHTVELAEKLGAKVIQHQFINQADQFNWGLANLSVHTEWIMRLDADEYLEPKLVDELNEVLPTLSDEIKGIYLKRKVYYSNKWIRFGGFYPQILLRVWRNGSGHCEQRWMDEHIVLDPGSKVITAKNDFVDDNQKGITFWIAKHNQYASREAADMLNQKYPLFPVDQQLIAAENDPQAKLKRKIKVGFYSKLPKNFRAFLYFCYRYFFLCGFLDGARGFEWHFMQAYWYRLLVDLKISELERKSGGDVEKLKQLFREDHGLKL